MECPPTERLIALDGEVERHIDICESCRTAVSTMAAGEAPAPSFGRYRVDSILGTGAMGIVYGGWDPLLERAVAIKVVRRADDAAGRQRLVREAQSLAQLSHRHVCQVYDAGTEGDEVWVAMERIDGSTLRGYAGTDPLAILIGAAEGLAAAHGAGIVHRDIKPENVLVTRDGRAVVSDFGLARIDIAPGLAPGASQASGLAGTPAYIAPEQLDGKRADARSDQYAFAVMAWELLTGKRPTTEAAAPARMSRRVARALRRALSHDPAARFPSMTALIAAIRPRPHRRIAMIAIASTAAVMAATGWTINKREAADPVGACMRSADRYHAIWTPSRERSMRAAFVATGQSFAVDTADRVAKVLDSLGKQFSTETHEACSATFAHGQASQKAFDLRRECLDHSLERLDQLLDVFAHADKQVVISAIDAATAIADLDRCRNVSVLLARQDEPADPRVRAAIADVRAKLAHVEALDGVGDYKQALALASELSARAAKIDFPLLRAEVAHRVAAEQMNLGNTLLAEPELQRAAAAAEAGRDDLLAAYAWIRLMSAARARRDFDEAARRGEQAQAKLERVGNPANAVGFFLASRAMVAYVREDFAAARVDYERAVAVSEPLASRPRASAMLSALAKTYDRLGLRDLLMTTSSRAAELAEKSFGPDHPVTADALSSLALAQSRNGMHAKAVAMIERTIAIRTRVYGSDSTYVAGSLNELAAELTALGDLDGARAKLEQALAVRTKLLGPDHPETLVLENNLGRVLSQHHPRDAVPHLQHVLAVRSAKDASSQDVASALGNLGHAQYNLGDHAAARASWQRELAMYESKFGRKHRLVAMSLYQLGKLDIEDGRRVAAIAKLERAVAIDDLGQRDPGDVAEERFTLANALWPSNGKRAVALAMAARGDLQGTEGTSALSAAIDKWLRAHRVR